MNFLNSPITNSIVAPLIQAASEGPFGEVLEFAGVTNPELLTDMGTSPGSAASAMFGALGYDPEFASALGMFTDAYTGNVQGLVSQAGEASGNEQAAQLFSLAGQLPM